MAKVSLSDVRARASTVDRTKRDATTEEDIRRHKADEGYADMVIPTAARVVLPPKELRIKLALTQQEIADALRIPVATWRNWEQGRVELDPAARSLLALVQENPDIVFGALSGFQ